MLRLFLVSLVILSAFTAEGAIVKPLPSMGLRLVPFPNPGVREIDHPEVFDRVFAISDVHGMYFNLRQLLVAQRLIAYDQSGKVHWTAKKSLLIVVGDSIDKGPDSLNVLELWRELAEEAPKDGGAVIHLLGNHEAEFLANPEGHKASAFIDELRRKGVPLQQVLNPAFPLGRYLRQMPLAARVGVWLFCHSGMYPALPWEVLKGQASQILTAGAYSAPLLLDPNSILESKDWWKDPVQRTQLEGRLLSNGFYGVVFGHQPAALGVKGEIAGVDQLKLIKIDTGMAPEADEKGSGPGHLLLFSNARQLRVMGPPEAYSLSPVTARRLPSQ